ncbi:MAG TPA: hypothetical protein VLJ41_07895, partial [Segetibacter sp.]|nr:hypothetical protein [Segetibacter sp.]
SSSQNKTYLKRASCIPFFRADDSPGIGSKTTLKGGLADVKELHISLAFSEVLSEEALSTTITSHLETGILACEYKCSSVG